MLSRSASRFAWMACTLGFSLLASVPVTAQNPLVKRFDMGLGAPHVAPGFIKIGKTPLYSPGTDGWVDQSTNPTHTFRSGENLAEDGSQLVYFTVQKRIAHTFGDAQDRFNLLVDGVEGPEMTFRVDLPNGLYDCVVYLGNPGQPFVGQPGEPGMGRTPRVHMDVYANGDGTLDPLAPSPLVADDVYALTLQSKNSFAHALGGYRKVRFTAEVTNGTANSDGFLDLHVAHDTASALDNAYWQFTDPVSSDAAILAIEIYEHQMPPVVFENGELVASPGATSALGTAVSVFNADNYDLALVTLEQLNGGATPIEKAWMYAWYLGWMRGEPEVVTEGDKQLLEATRSLLEGLDQDDSSVALLLDELNDFQRGARLTELRGYGNQIYPEESVGQIVFNLSAGLQLLWQMSDDYLSDVVAPHETESPFYAKARYLMARNMYGRNTYLSEPLSHPFNDLWWTQIYSTEFDFNRVRDDLYPKDVELQVYAWFFQNFVFPNGDALGQSWDPTNPPPVDLQDAWWYPLVDVSAVSGGIPPPEWARLQNASVRIERDAAKWWIDNRLKPDGAYDPQTGTMADNALLGTPGGDDVEAAGKLLRLALTLTMPDHPLERVMVEFMDRLLRDENEINGEEGYNRIVRDVEHSAESTAFPLTFLMPLRYGDPRYIEFAERLISNMAGVINNPTLGDDDPWTASYFPTGSSSRHRHFRSWKLGAGGDLPGVDTGFYSQRDTPINARALLAGYHLIDFNQSPGARTLFVEYARAWAEAAMWDDPATPYPKPPGVFPGSANVTALPVEYGWQGNWWVNPASATAGDEYFSLDDGGQQYWRALYSMLVYAYRLFPGEPELLEPLAHAALWLYSTTPDEGAAEGSGPWAASMLRGRITNPVMDVQQSLLELFNEINGTHAQIPGFNADVIASLIEDYGGARAELEEPTPVGGKDKAPVEAPYKRAVDWMTHYFPFATSGVMFTDRLNDRFPGEYATHVQGEQINTSAPEFLLQWADAGNDTTDDVLDVALFINEFRNDYLRVLAYNFEDHRVDLDMTVLRGMDAGDYKLYITRDQDADEHGDMLGSGIDVVVSKPGQVIRVENIAFHVPVVIELVRQPGGPTTFGPASAYDLGISPLDAERDPSGNIVITVHNVGSLDHLACGTVRLLDVNTLAVLHEKALPAIPAQADYSDDQFPSQNPLAPMTAEVAFPGTSTLQDFVVEIDTSPCPEEEKTSLNNSLTTHLD